MTPTQEVPRCPACKAHDFREGVIEEVRQFDGNTYKATLPAMVCVACDEALVTGDVLELYEKALTRAVALGPSGAKALRWLMSWTALKNSELAGMLQVSHVTVSRWRNGERPVDSAAFALVSLIALESLGYGAGVKNFLRERSLEPGQHSVTLDFTV